MNELENTEFAGFWIRVLATLIDAVLISLITLPPLIGIYGMEYFESTALIVGGWDLWFSWILPAIIVIAFWFYLSATPGKIITKLKIIDAESGGKPRLSQCIGRYFAYFISILPLFLGMFWVAIDKRKQGFHDKLAGTFVVKVSEKQ